MRLATGTRTAASVQGKLKLARLLELPERNLDEQVRAWETDPRFLTLRACGALSLIPADGIRFGRPRFGGVALSSQADGIGDALDEGLIKLIRAVGQESFESLFLSDSSPPDADVAAECGISPVEVRRIRGLVTRLYINEEIGTPAPAAAPSRAYSVVAGVEVVSGAPVLAFFNREIWKARYRVDEARLAELKKRLSASEFAALRACATQVELVERRKTTLYRILETILPAQAAFLASGDPDDRRPLTQREVSIKLDICPTVLNRLIATKSVQMPWGLEAPLKAFFPSRKTIMRSKIDALIGTMPAYTDRTLLAALGQTARLSRRSIAQYRKELRISVP